MPSTSSLLPCHCIIKCLVALSFYLFLCEMLLIRKNTLLKNFQSFLALGAESTHSAEVSVPSCTMPSADRYTTSPTLNVFISSSPNTISLYDHTLVDPLSSIYSTSPPLIEEHPPVFHNIQDHPQSQSRLGQHRETLRKCLSESYASDSFQQYHLTGCKEVYIPPTDTSGDNNEKNVRSNPRLGTSNGAVSAGVKHSVEVASIYKLGHKRSQSDFGVGAASARNSDFAPSPDLGNGAEPSEGKTAESAASSAAGKTSQRTSQGVCLSWLLLHAVYSSL